MKHVVIVPLKASMLDTQRIEFLMKCSGHVRNATLGTMLRKVEQLRRNKTWRKLANKPKSKARTDQYNQLKKNYRLSEFDCIKVAQQHAKNSRETQDTLGGDIDDGSRFRT